jgi:hypothetical protein
MSVQVEKTGSDNRVLAVKHLKPVRPCLEEVFFRLSVEHCADAIGFNKESTIVDCFSLSRPDPGGCQ